MDVRFLKTISEAFIVKYSLQESLTVDLVFEDTYDLIKELRETDIELYDHLYDSPKLQQQAILMSYFALQYGDKQEKLEEIGLGLTLGFVIGGILSYLYGGRITKAMLSFGTKIAKVMEKVGKSLVRRGRYWKFRYAIIQQNAKKCYVGCGVSEKDIGTLHYISTGDKPLPITSVKARRQGKCLSACYVNYTIESIALLTKSYFVCLKKTGEFDQIQNLKGDDTLKILSGLKLSNTCVDFYNEMRDLYSEFHHLLDYVYGRDESKKTDAMRRLKDKLISARNEVGRSNNLNRYN
jgi:hypothetical protein